MRLSHFCCIFYCDFENSLVRQLVICREVFEPKYFAACSYVNELAIHLPLGSKSPFIKNVPTVWTSESTYLDLYPNVSGSRRELASVLTQNDAFWCNYHLFFVYFGTKLSFFLNRSKHIGSIFKHYLPGAQSVGKNSAKSSFMPNGTKEK